MFYWLVIYKRNISLKNFYSERFVTDSFAAKEIISYYLHVMKWMH